jgi:hypothetical protein
MHRKIYFTFPGITNKFIKDVNHGNLPAIHPIKQNCHMSLCTPRSDSIKSQGAEGLYSEKYTNKGDCVLGVPVG